MDSFFTITRGNTRLPEREIAEEMEHDSDKIEALSEELING